MFVLLTDLVCREVLTGGESELECPELSILPCLHSLHMNKLTDTIHQEMIEMMLVTSYSNISICPLIFLQIKYFDVNYGITFQIHDRGSKGFDFDVVAYSGSLVGVERLYSE